MVRARNRLFNGVISILYRNSDTMEVKLAVWGVIILIIVFIIVLCYLRFNEICCYCCQHHKEQSREKTKMSNNSLNSTKTNPSYENIPLVP